MRAGTLSDGKVVKTLNESFVPILVDLTDRSNVEAGKIFRKYAIQNSIPQLVFLTPEGKQLKELQHVGGLTVKELLGKLEKLKEALNWFTNLDEAIARGKKVVKPVLSVEKQKRRSESKELFDGLVNELTKSGITDLVILHKTFVKTKEEPDIVVNLIDPLGKNEATTLTAVVYDGKEGSLEEAVEKIKSFVSDFEQKYRAHMKYYCPSCGDVADDEKECCGSQMKPVLTFRCEECGNYSAEQKECCGRLMEPATK